MSVSHQEAKLVAGFILADYEHERATTRKVLEAVPAGQEAYSPDGRSMNALALSWHIASAEKFFFEGVISGAFNAGEPGVPESIRSAADVLAWYDSNLPAVLDAVKALPAETLTREIDFFGMFKAPALTFLSLMLRHSIHHRGQLSAYLRPMGAKVPGIYGPSGDAPIA
jgi:uncharacterized damage-inducible protein DinB